MADLGRYYPYQLNRDMFLAGQNRWGFPTNMLIEVGTTPYSGVIMTGWSGPYWSREGELRDNGNGIVYRWFPPPGADPNFLFEWRCEAQDATKHLVQKGFLRMSYSGVQMGNLLPTDFDTYLPAPEKYSGTMNRFAPGVGFATISWQKLRGSLWNDFPLTPAPN